MSRASRARNLAAKRRRRAERLRHAQGEAERAPKRSAARKAAPPPAPSVVIERGAVPAPEGLDVAAPWYVAALSAAGRRACPDWAKAVTGADGVKRRPLAAEAELAGLGLATWRPQDFVRVTRGAARPVERRRDVLPGYLLVSGPLDLVARAAALDGVAGLMCGAGGSADELRRPARLRPGFMAWLVRRQSGAVVLPAPATLAPGRKVRVLAGPFASFDGLVERLTGRGAEVWIDVFGRPVPVELGLDEIRAA
jgi:transcription antitermination factor NusG